MIVFTKNNVCSDEGYSKTFVRRLLIGNKHEEEIWQFAEEIYGD